MAQIMIVEEDWFLNGEIKFALDDGKADILQCYCFETARKLVFQNEIDLVILDTELPDGDGFALLKEIKVKKARTSVILLIAPDSEENIEFGKKYKADDYIFMPFELSNLREKVQAQLT